jgi:hypothetical protein
MGVYISFYFSVTILPLLSWRLSISMDDRKKKIAASHHDVLEKRTAEHSRTSKHEARQNLAPSPNRVGR